MKEDYCKSGGEHDEEDIKQSKAGLLKSYKH